MALTSRISFELTSTLTSVLDLGSATAPLSYPRQITLANGTAAGQADKLWHDRRTLAASTTEDLDLTGTLTDAFGATITVARIKGLLISASAANSNNVVVGAAAGNAWAALLNATGTITLRPGASLLVAAGQADAVTYTVTAGTADLLKVANSGAGSSVTYDIAFIGASA